MTAPRQPILVMLLAAAVFLAWLPPASAQAQNKRLVETPISDAPSYTKYALVIGVTDYDVCPKLTVCGNDAKEFAELLKTKMGFPDVILMTDAPGTPGAMRPTQRNLKRALDTLYGGIIADKSEVVLFFSGHGVRARDLGGNDADWLVPNDGDAHDVPGTCINYDAIRQRLDTLHPARVVLVTDACRSLLQGKAAGQGSGFGKGLRQGPLGMEVAELQSCQPTEVSQEGLPEDFSESVFTHYLLKGLNGDPDAAEENGLVTFDSLKQYVQASVYHYVASHFGNTPQNPDGRATLGRMVLARIAALPPTVTPEIVVPPLPLTPPVPITPLPITPPIPVTPSGAKINPKDGAEMVYVAPGAFQMGDDDVDFIKSDNPRHTVTLSGYYIYKNLVTVAMYKKFCEATGRTMPDAPPWGWKDDHPMVNVTWDDAKAYCDWAGVHLPTEAQWEKAARGTDGRKYPWGNDFDASRLQCSKSAGGDAGSTSPVGSFPSGASPCGALDMAGNVWQWCSDWYDEGYWKSERGVDPLGPVSSQSRVLRGGSWDFNDYVYFRAAFRIRGTPAIHNYNCGFRGSSGP